MHVTSVHALVVVADPSVCSFYQNFRVYIRFFALIGYDPGTAGENPASARLGGPGVKPGNCQFFQIFSKLPSFFTGRFGHFSHRNSVLV